MSSTAFDPYVGELVTVTLTHPASAPELQGRVFCYDSSLRCLVLQSNTQPTLSEATFHLINVDTIAQVSKVSAGPGSSDKDVLLQTNALDVTRLRQREEKAVNAARLRATKIGGPGVTREAQLIFNELDRILSCRWDGTNIIVLDDIQLSAPYTVDHVSPITTGRSRAHADGELQAAIGRIRQIIEGLHKKK